MDSYEFIGPKVTDIEPHPTEKVVKLTENGRISVGWEKSGSIKVDILVGLGLLWKVRLFLTV